MEKEQKSTNQGSHPEFWRGLEDYNNDPAFRQLAEQEFMSSPHSSADGKDGFARREFLKLMGASLALATTACVRRPAQLIVPYAQAPKDVIPGISNVYASTWVDGNEGCGILVRTLEGRPIKLEGNPLHPMSRGGLSARAQAAILSLYDPDRLKGPTRNLQNKTRSNREPISTTWEKADTLIVEQLKKGKVAILSQTMPSPSAQAIIADFLKAYGGRHFVWDVFPMEDIREANKVSFGRDVIPGYRFDKAKMIVSIDTDIIGSYLSQVEFNKQWAIARKPTENMGRLVAFESNVALTGLNADDRFKIKPSQQLDVVLGLLYEVGVNLAKAPLATSSRNRVYLETYKDVPRRLGIDAVMFKKVAEQLWDARGKSVVVAGGLSTKTAESTDLQIAVNMLNSVLGNIGQTIDLDNSTYNFYQGSMAQMDALTKAMKAGEIETLIIDGSVNPIYSLPDAQPFLDAVSKVKLVVSTANSSTETAVLADYVLPAGTQFESWGDWELQTGLYSIQQPTIRPLFDSRSLEESLLVWTKASAQASARAKNAATWHDFVKENWHATVFPAAGKGKSFDDFWVEVLQNGVVDAKASQRDVTGTARTFASEALSVRPRAAQEGLELVLYATGHMHDGQMANIPWLHELPDVVTKIVWDNYASVGPGMAAAEKLVEGSIIDLKVGTRTLKVPVHIQPGQHDNVIALSVGFGRTRAGRVGNGLGVNAFPLAAAADGKVFYAGLPASYKKTSEKYSLVSPQGFHQLKDELGFERPHVAETTLGAFLKAPESGIHRHHAFSIWPNHSYNKHKWAMSIDLNACTGCSACVTACMAENNIPTVGKEYVLQGREMHWIRIDRYYKGTPENPDAVFQPMTCQHCENAPCETVCPVLATTHNEEGLNDMVYNRCVGTRYCANNCPYKVRRFNWFNYSKRESPTNMQLNPNVTVRSRGVMEKCSLCVHRIRAGTNQARDQKRPLRDGEIKTACQETCPSDAIVFGDLADENSQVSKLFKNPRTYVVLEELNTAPRVRYMSRVRNAERTEAKHQEGHA